MKWNGKDYRPLVPQKIVFKEEKFDVEEYLKSLAEKFDRVPVWRAIPNPLGVNVSEPSGPPPTPSITPSNTPTVSITASQTMTPTPSVTAQPTGTPTNTPSQTETPVTSPTSTLTPSPTQSPTPWPDCVNITFTAQGSACIRRTFCNGSTLTNCYSNGQTGASGCIRVTDGVPQYTITSGSFDVVIGAAC
jgi:hypothetical protein